MELVGFALAGLIGLTLGLMGGGGSILTVPVLVYVLGYGAKPAIAMSLPVVGLTSMVGALGHWRAGNVDWRTGAMLGIVTMGGAYVGARLAVFLTGATQLAVLAVVMVAAALSMLRAKGSPAAPAEPGPVAPPARRRLAAVGFAVGVLTGIVGIGGGFLIVPALVVLGRVPMKQAIGTSLLVIAMNSAAGYAGYAGTVDVPWRFVAAFAGVAIGGILVGTWLVRFVSAASLKRGFAVFLLAVAGLMLYQNRGVFLAANHTDTRSGAPVSAGD
jgi:uncharacterized membrane protein YfcA